eukprot:CAMPEP_0176161586 /NCGR_PEP_ID=MMETSP0120_2-20121206/82672_1 /TAXON_ID=160619 /ORGANISM="Kryptoperidinium foliaceum, Strain CCMP 1326" /LENGTH=33 /DNA_ID= /DNA_START= /DNA_END= /DNA_ORIENTATION=
MNAAAVAACDVWGGATVAVPVGLLREVIGDGSC